MDNNFGLFVRSLERGSFAISLRTHADPNRLHNIMCTMQDKSVVFAGYDDYASNAWGLSQLKGGDD